MAKITRPQSGNVVRDARRQVRGAEQFGNVNEVDTRFNKIPEQAFGDSQGQIALANAVGNAGNIILDVNKRKEAIDSTAEKVDFQNKTVNFKTGEQKLRAVIKQTGIDENLNAKVQLELYNTGVAALKDDIWGDYDYEYITKEDFKTVIDRDIDKLSASYLAGTHSTNVIDGMKSSLVDTISNIIDTGFISGQESDMLSAEGVLVALDSLAETPEYMGLFGAALPKHIEDAKSEYIINFAKGLGTKDPDVLQTFLETPGLFDSFSPEIKNDLTKTIESIISKANTEKLKKSSTASTTEYDRLVLDSANGNTLSNKEINDNLLLSNRHKAILINVNNKAIKAINDNLKKEKEKPDLLAKAKRAGYRGTPGQDILLGNDFQDRTFNDFELMKSPTDIVIHRLRIISEYNKVPRQVADSINNNIANGRNSTSVPVDIEIVKFLSTQDPLVFKNLSQDTLDIVSMVNNGISIENARAFIIQGKSMTKDQRNKNKEILLDFTDEDARDVIRTDVADVGFFEFAKGDVPPGMIRDFRVLYERNLQRFTDPELAKNNTISYFKSPQAQWKLNTTDGSERFMKLGFRQSKATQMKFDRLKLNHRLTDQNNIQINLIRDSDPVLPLYTLSVDGRILSGVVRDAQGNIKYNINNEEILEPIIYSPYGKLEVKRF